jgi:hypothetical protein
VYKAVWASAVTPKSTGDPLDVTGKSPYVRFAPIAALVLALVLVPAAVAGKGVTSGKPGGGGSSSGSVSLVMTDENSNGVPNWGETVTFTVSTTATSRPFVSLSCYQSGVRVYSFSAGIFPDYAWTQTYTLRSSNWTGGPADCTATGYYFTSNGREKVFGTTSFPVSA